MQRWVSIVLCFLLAFPIAGKAQSQVMSTKGTEFWLGFMNGYQPFNPDSLTIRITSDISTTGTLSIPRQGYSQPFQVNAYGVITLRVPALLVEHLTSEQVSDKGILVKTQEPVAVFAEFSRLPVQDATYVLPTKSLGDHYLVNAYTGSSAHAGSIGSQLLIVATKDSTALRITPSATTWNSKPAGIPFTVVLDRGESYQVRARAPSHDLTGTEVIAVDTADCKPFAVFGGSMCANVPINCLVSCDQLFHQNLPLKAWGTEYFVVPFDSVPYYTYRVVASEDNTSIVVDGTTVLNLNAGQYYEANHDSMPHHIISNRPIAVNQYIESSWCYGQNGPYLNGDPDFIVLNSKEQQVYDCVFQVDSLDFVNSLLDTTVYHYFLNIVTPVNGIGSITVDGMPLNPVLFQTFPSTPAFAFAQVPLSGYGVHRYASPEGSQAYVYGLSVTGGDAIAFSLGMNTKTYSDSIQTVWCANDTAIFRAPPQLVDHWWHEIGDQGDTLSHSDSLALYPPLQGGTYVVTGYSGLTQCPVTDTFFIELPDSLMVSITASEDSLCIGESSILSANVGQGGSGYSYVWTSSEPFTPPFGPLVSTTPSEGAWFYCEVTSPGGCNTGKDSIYLEVFELPEPDLGSDVNICQEDTVILTLLNTHSDDIIIWQDSLLIDSLMVTKPGVYTVRVLNAIGCEGEDEIQVIQYQPPLIDLGEDITLCEGEEVLIEGPTGYQYLWSTGDTSQSIGISPMSDQTLVWLEIMDNNQCTNTDTLFVAWEICPDLYIPNAFSPNGDGVNDYFTFGAEGISIEEFRIYDRWGALVYEGSDAVPGWNGTLNGRECPVGVYAYFVKYESLTIPGIQVKQGNLTLLR